MSSFHKLVSILLVIVVTYIAALVYFSHDSGDARRRLETTRENRILQQRIDTDRARLEVDVAKQQRDQAEKILASPSSEDPAVFCIQNPGLCNIHIPGMK